MPVTIPADARKAALASLERHAAENLEEPLGNIAAGAFLDFILVEMGPLIYNQVNADAKDRPLPRVMEVDGDRCEEPFRYWRMDSPERVGRGMAPGASRHPAGEMIPSTGNGG